MKHWPLDFAVIWGIILTHLYKIWLLLIDNQTCFGERITGKEALYLHLQLHENWPHRFEVRLWKHTEGISRTALWQCEAMEGVMLNPLLILQLQQIYFWVICTRCALKCIYNTFRYIWRGICDVFTHEIYTLKCTNMPQQNCSPRVFEQVAIQRETVQIHCQTAGLALKGELFSTFSRLQSQMLIQILIKMIHKSTCSSRIWPELWTEELDGKQEKIYTSEQ